MKSETRFRNEREKGELSYSYAGTNRIRFWGFSCPPQRCGSWNLRLFTSHP